MASSKYPTSLGRLGNGLLGHTNDVAEYLTPTAKGNSSKSPLLFLPAELRNQIWHYVTQDSRAYICVKPSSHSNPDCNELFRHNTATCDAPPYVAFQLPRVCRQIYAETSVLLYERTTFILPMCVCRGLPAALQVWASQLLPDQRESVKAVSYSLDTNGVWATPLKELFPNLNHITLRRHWHSHWSVDDEGDVVSAIEGSASVSAIRENEGGNVQISIQLDIDL